MPFEQSIQSFDFASAPATSHTFTLPAGHTIARIFSIGLTGSTGSLVLLVGTGGTPDEGASDYIRAAGRNQADWGTPTVGTVLVIADEAQNGTVFQFHFYNMNTAAPVCCNGVGWDTFLTRPHGFWGIRQTITPLDQITIKSSGANITAGTIYCVSYLRETTVNAVDLDGTTITKAGLVDLRGMLVTCSFDCLFPSALTTGQMRVSTGGVVQVGASDYKESKVGGNFIDAVALDTHIGEAGDKIQPRFFNVSYGHMEADLKTMFFDGADLTLTAAGLGQTLNSGVFDTAEANNELSVFSSGAPTSGTVYFVEYAV